MSKSKAVGERRNRRGVRAQLAREFTGFIGTPAAFRALVGPSSSAEGGEDRDYHRVYLPDEVRRAKLRMLGVEDVLARRPASLGLPPVINSRMSKGGTGKTTIAANVASTLAMMGYKVLMIDGDPQASLTGVFGIDWATEEIEHIGHIMARMAKGKAPSMPSAVRSIYAEGMLDLIASDITLADTDTWLVSAMSRETIFSRVLTAEKEFLSQYDVIIVDSAPGTTLLTNAIMYGSGNILAVVWMDGQSLKAMEVLSSNIGELNETFASQGLKLTTHLVANGFHPSFQTCRDAWETLRQAYPDMLDDVRIPHASSFMRQIDLRQNNQSGPVLEREPSSAAARAIIDLTKSLIRHYDIRMGGHGAA